jgi:hypothetical protein
LKILALKLGDQGLETVIISFDSDGLEDGLDVLLGWRGISTEGKEEVSCEVLHFDSCEGGVVSNYVEVLYWIAADDNQKEGRFVYSHLDLLIWDEQENQSL